MLGKTEVRKRRGWQRRDGWVESSEEHEFEQTLGDGEGQGSLACCSSVGRCSSLESNMTQWLNNKNTKNPLCPAAWGCRRWRLPLHPPASCDISHAWNSRHRDMRNGKLATPVTGIWTSSPAKLADSITWSGKDCSLYILNVTSWLGHKDRKCLIFLCPGGSLVESRESP